MSVELSLKLTTLLGERAIAIMRRDWGAVKELDSRIKAAEQELSSALVAELWPGAIVKGTENETG